jgi:polysaccharide export outer membrane protein
MFKTDENSRLSIPDSLSGQFVIKPYDALTIEVYTKDGERLIDPDFALADRTIPNIESIKPKLTYLVQQDGTVKLPMIGTISLEGLTLIEAESVLQEEYTEFYQEPFVNLDFTNQRVTLLGAFGNEVIPLNDEKISVTEVLALAQAADKEAKVGQIRLLRGDETYVLDFSTVEGYQQSNMIVKPNDIIYVEPVRRPFAEGLRDYSPLFSVVLSLTSLIVVILSLN